MATIILTRENFSSREILQTGENFYNLQEFFDSREVFRLARIFSTCENFFRLEDFFDLREDFQSGYLILKSGGHVAPLSWKSGGHFP